MTDKNVTDGLAREILSIYGRFEIEPGRGLLWQAVRSNFPINRSAGDFQEGLDSCLTRGWLERSSGDPTMYLLTAEGYAVLQDGLSDA